jgi:large-conductance mechanosensitive channel
MKVEEEAARAREEKANNPTEIDLLKEIRDLLKEKEERTSE